MRLDWIIQVEEAFYTQIEADNRAGHFDFLFQRASQLCAWPLVLGMANELNKQQDLSIYQQLILAEAHFQMGYLGEAESVTRQIQFLQPKHSSALKLYRDVQQWSRYCEQFPMGKNYFFDGDAIYLQLLGHHHKNSFLSIYTEETAQLCCLPFFQYAEEWHAWLDSIAQLEDQLLFAVMHKGLGMVGVVSLILHGDVGFFYYWIGEDFRGLGFASTASTILLEGARQYWGMRTCYAKAFAYNHVSLRVLEKLNFESLSLSATFPYENEVFFRLGESEEMEDTTREMYWLYDQMRCKKTFTKPLVA